MRFCLCEQASRDFEYVNFSKHATSKDLEAEIACSTSLFVGYTRGERFGTLEAGWKDCSCGCRLKYFKRVGKNELIHHGPVWYVRLMGDSAQGMMISVHRTNTQGSIQRSSP